jgi:uncharacterized protein (DUF427 family)
MAPPIQREIPQPGQESVWDYPRPPACVPSPHLVTVSLHGRTIVESTRAFRILETSHPPTYYIPAADVAPGTLSRSSARSTFCEWKGSATYWDVVSADEVVLVAAAWSYEHPSPGYEAIAGYLAFSPAQLECAIDGEAVRPQEGGFYAGWITDDVVGPFKGGPGSQYW